MKMGTYAAESALYCRTLRSNGGASRVRVRVRVG